MKFFHPYYLLILVSLTTTTTTVADVQYAKAGCHDMCGSVRIPFPFGIGGSCAINHWYIVDCNSSTPYLHHHHLQLLRVDLGNHIVIVNTPVIANCSNRSQITSMDLGGSPFLFSRLHNKFVFEGCGNALMMDYAGRALTGCSTDCSNNSTGSEEKSSCLGITCCEKRIPDDIDDFKSYKVNLTQSEREGSDGGCGSAFLVNKNSYDHEGRRLTSDDKSFIPISLRWILYDPDYSNQVSCCGYLNRSYLDMGNDTAYTWGCLVLSNIDEKLYSGIEENPYLENGCYDRPAPKYTMTGCNDTCGDVRIPYPFGIGANCAINHWYIVDCNSSTPYSSTPYLSAFNLELLDVHLINQTITVNISIISDHCNNNNQMMSIDLGHSPFLFSKSHNKFVVIGCGNAVMMDNGSAVIGCSTDCHDNTTSEKNNSCLGITCCETTIPYNLKSYKVNLKLLERQGKDRGCGSAFLVDKNSYDEGRISDSNSSIPVSLLWTLSEPEYDQVTCCIQLSKDTVRVELGNGTTMDSWRCTQYSEGTPYLIDGCVGTVSAFTKDCERCSDSGGSCNTKSIYDVDGALLDLKFSCDNIPNERRSFMGIILGVSISSGVLFLVATSYALYKFIKKTKDKRQRKRFFKRNGGLLLKQQEAADSCFVDKTILFTSRELEKATDNFNENRILGRGGQGTVYKGMLVDGRIVAVKKSKIVDESQLEQFINEVVILSQVNHRNVVKLLGCCLETEIPLLVSEFIPNGTLYDHLHNDIDEFPISLNMRLQIATEVAGALAYLHSATSVPIYHRDIKTTNILLDDKYRAKVSDFGTSRFVSMDQTHLTTLVKGTFGYLDPEYFQSSQFTEKSDVYSFGVVLVELLTRERPISLTRFGENRSLATYFMVAMEEGHVMSIFDAVVIKEGTRDELLVLANLAMRCLNMNGKNRPTMKEVAMELETIRTSHIPSMVQTSITPGMYEEELSMLTYGNSSSTFLSFNKSVS